MKKCVLFKGIVMLQVPEETDVRILSEGDVQNQEKALEGKERWAMKENEKQWEKLSAKDRVRTDHIFIKEHDYFRRINFQRILWIQASGSYCCLHLQESPKLMLSFNLAELSTYLPSELFVRVHRSYIVNINYVDSFIGNMLCIGKEKIPISRQHKAMLIERLNVIGNVK